jgi:hypothetical protein
VGIIRAGLAVGAASVLLCHCFVVAAAAQTYTADQVQATHDLVIDNTLATNDPHMRACGPLPSDTRVLSALKYADGKSLVPLSVCPESP